jgi:hypothetical protein
MLPDARWFGRFWESVGFSPGADILSDVEVLRAEVWVPMWMAGAGRTRPLACCLLGSWRDLRKIENCGLLIESATLYV